MKHRRWYHVHLRSIILLVFIFSLLGWLNFNGAPADAMSRNSYGWPATAYNAWGPRRAADNDIVPKMKVFYDNLGALFGYVPNQWNFAIVFYDLAVCLFTLFIAVVLCERFANRKVKDTTSAPYTE